MVKKWVFRVAVGVFLASFAVLVVAVAVERSEKNVFDAKCGNYLRTAFRTPSLKEADEELTVAIAYIEQCEFKTSVVPGTSANAIRQWQEELLKARSIVRAARSEKLELRDADHALRVMRSYMLRSPPGNDYHMDLWIPDKVWVHPHEEIFYWLVIGSGVGMCVSFIVAMLIALGR